MENNQKKEIFLPGINNLLFMKEEEKMLKSYNQEFYSTLNTLKQTKLPTIKTETTTQNYFYEHHSNENAALTSTTGQIYTTIEDAYKLNLEIKKESIQIKDKMTEIRHEVEDIEALNEFQDYIKEIRNKVQNFLVDQKTETFKLVKEIALLTRDKIELQGKIQSSLEKIKRLEEEVGIKPTLHSNSIDDMIKTHVTYENRFFERDEIKYPIN